MLKLRIYINNEFTIKNEVAGSMIDQDKMLEANEEAGF